MIVFFAAIAGAVVGAFLARKRGGKRLDVLQYTFIYAVAFALLGLFATILVHRLSL
ncbi:hypothetical protein [Thiosulfatihalobacter marinus]|jgi:MFS-type transporter involved in bile tolerance (Atg22 family)|uniref:hypothetical protein n=1 Tax=Thiosulfatihalobacter marinus TaxID=2792481 RepID=UPI0018D78251|nr:hypothetical protein [Thiosulfatihalobacter marinus]